MTAIAIGSSTWRRGSPASGELLRQPGRARKLGAMALTLPTPGWTVRDRMQAKLVRAMGFENHCVPELTCWVFCAGRDLEERQQRKRSFEQSRMGQLKRGVVEDLVRDPKQIQIERSRSPMHLTLTPGQTLNLLDCLEDPHGRQRTVKPDSGVEVIRLWRTTDGWVLVNVGEGDNLANFDQLFECPVESAASLAEIGSNAEYAVRMGQHDSERYPMLLSKQPVRTGLAC